MQDQHRPCFQHKIQSNTAKNIKHKLRLSHHLQQKVAAIEFLQNKIRRHTHSKKPRERIDAGRNEKNKIRECGYQKKKKMQGMCGDLRTEED